MSHFAYNAIRMPGLLLTVVITMIIVGMKMHLREYHPHTRAISTQITSSKESAIGDFDTQSSCNFLQEKKTNRGVHCIGQNLPLCALL